MGRAADSGTGLTEQTLMELFNEMYDNPNPPVKILTPKDFKPREVVTILGVPVWADPMVGKDEVWVEYADGRRELLAGAVQTRPSKEANLGKEETS